jgi:hypothetical protein
MKSLLITILMLTFGFVAYAQTDSGPAAKTNCKEQQHINKAKKGKAKPARDGVPAPTDPAKEAAACPQSPDPALNAAPAGTTTASTGPTPTAALSSTAVAPPVDNRELNVTISHDSPEESLGAAARRMRAKKAAEEASKAQ